MLGVDNIVADGKCVRGARHARSFQSADLATGERTTVPAARPYPSRGERRVRIVRLEVAGVGPSWLLDACADTGFRRGRAII